MSARLTPAERLLRARLERDLQTDVERLATFGRWRWHHAPDNRPVTTTSGRQYVQNVRAGYPDLTLVRGPRLVVLELKREQGRYGPGQVEWLLDLQTAGVEVACVRPSTLPAVRRWLLEDEPLPLYVAPAGWQPTSLPDRARPTPVPDRSTSR